MAGISSVLGGIAGGALGGTVGQPAMGYALGSAIGGGIEGFLQEKKAEDMPLIGATPLQLELLSDMRNRRKALEAGTMYQPQQAAIQQTGMGAMREATKVSGGDVGATVSALQKLARGTGRSLNELYGQQMQAANQMQQMEIPVVTDISNQERDLANFKYSQAIVDARQKQKDAMQILGAVVAKQLGGVDMGSEEFAEFLKKVLEGNPTLAALFGQAAPATQQAASQTGAITTGSEISLPQSLFSQSLTGFGG